MNKMKKYNKKYGLAIFLIALTFFVGGLIIATLIYLNTKGTLGPILQSLKDVFIQKNIIGMFWIFWILLVPVLLIVLIVINSRRRKRVKSIDNAWQEAIKIAAERYQAEKTAKEEEEKNKPSRFNILKELDTKTNYLPQAKYQFKEITLKNLCDDFRNFAASNLGLFYSVSEIREFISALAVSHLVILQGMSGTGKTSLAYAFGEFISNLSIIIPVQPMWKERTDLLGYYNEFTKKFNETLLLQKMYEADSKKNMYIVVLDEMNIARVEYYFAEFLSLTEIPDPESRYLDVVPDKWDNDPQKLKDGRIKLPENMWFIGTANNDDSTFAISDKVYDRAMILNLNRKNEPFFAMSNGINDKITLSYTDFNDIVKKTVNEYEMLARNEHRLQLLDNYMIEKFQITFGNRIMKQIKNYIAVYVGCGGEELYALDDILAKKVFRKLESQNAAYVKSEAAQLHEFLNELFGATNMPRCHEYIDKLIRGV